MGVAIDVHQAKSALRNQKIFLSFCKNLLVMIRERFLQNDRKALVVFQSQVLVLMTVSILTP
ncbi:MAG: hypothetical protein DYG89_26160 [Caldilinea sp. CFX5]|nr:hypothetical protein [Caldilinea sp. CFX5]